MTTNKIEQYSAIETKIRSIGSELDGRVYDITTGAGLSAAKADRAIWRKLRTGVEAIRKETKADVLDLGRAIDAEAKRLTEIIRDGGTSVEEIVKAEEDRKAAEKEARDQAERKRIEDIQDRIDDFKFILSEFHPVEDLQTNFDGLSRITIEDDDDSFGEFKERAKNVLGENKNLCYMALEKAKVREKDAEELKAQQDKIDKENEQGRRMLKEQADKQAKEGERLKIEKADLERDRKANESADREEKMQAVIRAEIESAKLLNMEGSLRHILEICDETSLNDIQKVHKVRCAAVAQVEKMVT